MFHLPLIRGRARHALCAAAALLAALVAQPQAAHAAGSDRATRVADRPVMAWRGTGPDNLIWWSQFDGTNWSTQQPLTDRRTEAAPALTRGTNGQLLMAWRGASDNHILWSQYTGYNWSAPQELYDRRTDGAPALGF
ncbi:hypothetical protein AB0H73_33975 [Streptomyces olivoreticuli]